MDWLLVSFGSTGDVLPFVGLGQALSRRGHAVAVATFGSFEGLVRAAGLDFVALPPPDRSAGKTNGGAPGAVGRGLRRLLVDPFFRSWRRLARVSTIVPMLRPVYETVAGRHRPGRTFVAACSSALGARIARDRLGVPLVTVHLSPALFRSALAPPRQPPLTLPPGMPSSAWQALYSCADRFVLDPLLCPAINEFRAGLGLSPVRGVLGDWRHSPDCVAGLFPPWFALPQPDWPAAARLTGFPLFDDAGLTPVPAEVEAFLDRGEPPLVFTAGTNRRDARRFFGEAVGVCRLLRRRGLLLTRYPEQLPSRLPADVGHAAYAPLSQVLPRSAALFHHGGIGTAARALAAGIPQIVVPRRNDQHENGRRLAVGAGRVVSAGWASARFLAENLLEMLTDSEAAAACQGAARRLAAACPVEETCRLFEELESRTQPRGVPGGKRADGEKREGDWGKRGQREIAGCSAQ